MEGEGGEYIHLNSPQGSTVEGRREKEEKRRGEGVGKVVPHIFQNVIAPLRPAFTVMSFGCWRREGGAMVLGVRRPY